MSARFSLVFVAAGSCLVLAMGCGSGEQTSQTNPIDRVPAGNSDVVSTEPPEMIDEPNSPVSEDQQAASVVQAFLDRIRRGGQDQPADEFLTTAARVEVNRVGGVATIGAPDSQFIVTRTQSPPADDGSPMLDAKLVHSIWRDTFSDSNGSSVQDTEVVWALQREFDQWRISGMALQTSPNVEPTIIDFENRQQMVMLFGAPTQNSTSPQTASKPNDLQDAPVVR